MSALLCYQQLVWNTPSSAHIAVGDILQNEQFPDTVIKQCFKEPWPWKHEED